MKTSALRLGSLPALSTSTRFVGRSSLAFRAALFALLCLLAVEDPFRRSLTPDERSLDPFLRGSRCLVAALLALGCAKILGFQPGQRALERDEAGPGGAP